MHTGALALAAASRTAFAVDDDDTFTAGIAYPLALAWSRSVIRSLPVTTPGATGRVV